MNLDLLSSFLLWSLVANYSVLLVWFFALVVARDAVRRLHGRWFRLSDASFDAIHYGAMAGYKLAILFFNLVPYVVLGLIRADG